MVMDEAERVYRVALFGVIGTGKSSIINLLAGKQMADISTNVEPCTRRARWYPISLGEKNFRLWDTMGFNLAETKDIHPLSPYEQAHTLLRNLPNGIDLILLCARADRVTASLRKLYWLLNNFFFGGRAQIALVLTHLDTVPEERQSDWLDRNIDEFSRKSGIPVRSLPHACITTVHNGSPQSDLFYQQSKQALETLLNDNVVINPTPFPLDFPPAAAVESLITHCQLGTAEATRLVERFSSPKRHFNVVLFGESGAGKSSIINLLAGRQVAKVSINLSSCTLDFSQYEIDAGSHQLRVWDTVGLNGMYIGRDRSWEAVENAVELIRSLRSEGGVDLLVFCKKAGRFLPPELNSFRIFQEFLCEGRIPVAFIITQLEFISPMEQWWEKNGKELVETCGLKPNAIVGHACITSLPLDDPNSQVFREKILLSRQSIQTMLGDAISYGDAFLKDQEPWVVSFLNRLAVIIRGGNLPRKMTVTNLMERCGLSKEHAEALIKRFLSKQG